MLYVIMKLNKNTLKIRLVSLNCTKIKIHYFLFALLGHIQNKTTTTTYATDNDLMNNYQSDSSNSSVSSSPTDLPLFIHGSPTIEEPVVTLPASLIKENTICNVNSKHQVSPNLTNQSSTISKKSVYAKRKCPATSEEPIALRLKRSRVKKTN